MAESTPPSRSRNDSGDEPRSSRPLRLVDERPRDVMPSHPPSEPRPIPGRPGADAGPDRPAARVQLIVVLLLLLVLVVVPLYLWRRPRAVNEEADAAVATASAQAVASAAPVTGPDADAGVRSKDGVTLGETKVVGCHDPGPRRTPQAECDRLTGFEAAFARAILDNAACLPPNTAAGAITYIADVSYGRRHNPIRVTYAHEATSVPTRAAAACAVDVKKALVNTPLDGKHAHSRYEIEIAASYAGGK